MNDLNYILENNFLKKEFAMLNLDLSQVFNSIPDDIERENRILKDLLDWVQKYFELGSRRKMEGEGYEFPPIEPCISPENDWYMFEQWVNGIPIRKKTKELLPSNYVLKNPEELSDVEIITELQILTEILEKFNISFQLRDEIPPGLLYSYLLGTMDEEHEMLIEGVWNLDGCTGYCPGCFQRPWCESGNQSCWTEDEEAGKMFLDDSVKKYVSASPVSLLILRKFQAEHDEEFKNFMENDDKLSIDPGHYDNIEDFDPDDDYIPF